MDLLSHCRVVQPCILVTTWPYAHSVFRLTYIQATHVSMIGQRVLPLEANKLHNLMVVALIERSTQS